MSVLEGLQPASVFKYFEDICGIPHGSRDTKKISDYLVQFAKKQGLRYVQDESNNVIIWKDGTAGYEDHAPVMLQGHMDMVCEKEADCTIDFTKDGLDLRLEDGIISAKGTTLGGDDGIAVAYALAILASDDIPHPPLEVVLTVDEEIGMLGAAALDASVLKSRTMLNMDSEDEGFFLVSCAGGCTSVAHLPVQREAKTGTALRLVIDGLQGGHSGAEIHKGRANANQLLGRVLYAMQKEADIALYQVQGGSKDNAIPRQAQADLVVEESQKESLYRIAEAQQKELRDEYQYTDAEITISLNEAEQSEWQPMTKESTQMVIDCMLNLPGGIVAMDPIMDHMVQTSLNMGILTSSEEEVRFSFCVRSSVDSQKVALVDRLESFIQAKGGTLENAGNYPAWEYRKDSPLRDTMVATYQKMYGKDPVVQGLHAGVECGLFSGKLPGLDCVSYGPDMKDIHTPKESMCVESVKRTWDFTLEVLKQL